LNKQNKVNNDIKIMENINKSVKNGTTYQFTSSDIKNQMDYSYTMELIDDMLKIKPVLGSQKVGHTFATFYKEQIDKMLENEKVNLEILSNLQIKVHNDLIVVRQDRNQRAGNSVITDEQTKKNDIMMSMIMDFIATLPEAKFEYI
jgi:hypothetical protein